MWLGKIGLGQDRFFLVTMIKIDRVVHLVISSSEPFRKRSCIQSCPHNLLVLPIHVIPMAAATGILKGLEFEGFNCQLRWRMLLLAQVVEVNPLYRLIGGVFGHLEIAAPVLCLFFQSLLLVGGPRLGNLHGLRSVVSFLRFHLSRFRRSSFLIEPC